MIHHGVSCRAPWYSMEIASANVESARVAMFALVGGVDGGGVGVGVSSEHGVVLGAEHVE